MVAETSNVEHPFAFSREVSKRAAAAAVFHADYTPSGFMSFAASRDLLGVKASFRSKTDGVRLHSLNPCVAIQKSGTANFSEGAASARLPKYLSKWKVGVESSLEPPTIMTAVRHPNPFNGFANRYFIL